MSFQGYLRTINEKTGKTGPDFVELARAKGFLDPKTKATPVVAWLGEDYGLGKGHAMAIERILKAARANPDGWQAEIEKWA